jgi:hypothetical protein
MNTETLTNANPANTAATVVGLVLIYATILGTFASMMGGWL